MKKQKLVDILGYAVLAGWFGTFFIGDICVRYSLSQAAVSVWMFLLLIVCVIRITVFQKIPKGDRRHYQIAFNRFDTLIHPYTQTAFILFFCICVLVTLFEGMARYT